MSIDTEATKTEPQIKSPLPPPVDRNLRQQQLAESLQGQTAEQISRRLLARELWADRQKKHRAIDVRTTLFAPALFDRTLDREIDLAQREPGGPGIGLTLLDLDDFGLFNKENGQPAGNEVLNNVGKTIKGTLRSTDMAFREGGEELAVIMTYTGQGPKTEEEIKQSEGEEYVDPSERIRRAIEEAKSKNGFKTTASIGQTDYVPGETREEFYIRADRARRIAKKLGKNRVVKTTGKDLDLIAHDITHDLKYSAKVRLVEKVNEKGKKVIVEEFDLTPLEVATAA